MRSRFFVLSLVFGLKFSLVCCQHLQIDSLENLLKTQTAVNIKRFELVFGLSQSFRHIDNARAVSYGQQAYRLALDLNYLEGQYRSLHHLWNIYMDLGELLKSLETIRYCVSVAQKMSAPDKIALSKARLGISYCLLDYQSRAFEQLTEAVDLYKEIRDWESVSIFTIMIGNIYLSNGDFGRAQKFYDEALSFSKGNLNTIATINLNTAELLQKQGKYLESFDFINSVLKWGEENKKPALVGTALMLYGKGYREIKQLSLAKSSFTRALGIFTDQNNIDARADGLIELGEIYATQRNFDSAMRYFVEALPYSSRNLKYSQLVRICSNIADIFEITGKLDDAVRYQERVLQYKDSLNSVNQQNILGKLKARYEVEKSERELQLTIEQNQLSRYLIGVLSLMGILLLGWLVFLISSGKGERIIMRGVLKANRIKLEMTLAQKTLIEQSLILEFESINRELPKYSSLLAQRNEMLESIKSEVDALKRDAQSGNFSRAENLLSTVEAAAGQEEGDWEIFQYYFQKVHEQFFDKLKEYCSELNSFELRLCALIRLNLQTKQIASVLDMTNEGAKVARHRLRKKLNISSEDSFNILFNSL